jgi:hypothetical protein
MNNEFIIIELVMIIIDESIYLNKILLLIFVR